MATTAAITRHRRTRIPAKDRPPKAIIRGNLLSYLAGLAYNPPPAGQVRNDIAQFTKASRLRMLKFVATIDYRNIRDSSFLTLTYPPECENADYRKRTRQRFALMRQIENYADRRISGLWRTEWMPRLSGRTKGNIAPHIHLLLFGVPFLPKQLLVSWWGNILRSDDEPVIHIRRATGEGGAAFYISKYCGKVAPTCLVNASYLRKCDGRHWGYLRSRQIPRWPEEVIERPTPEQVSYMLSLARSMFPQGDIRQGESFTLFGEYVKTAKEIIREIGLTKHTAKP